MDSVLSSSYAGITGVRQRSFRGPILFAVFTDNLPTATSSPAELYAGDTLVYENVDLTEVRDGLDLLPKLYGPNRSGCFASLKIELLPIGQDAEQQCLEERIEIERQLVPVAFWFCYLE